MNTTDIIPIPSQPNPAHHEQLARDITEVYNTGDTAALQRIIEHYNRNFTVNDLRSAIQQRLGMKADDENRVNNFSFADAQKVIAREYGFENWQQFVEFSKEIIHKDSAVTQFESAVDAIVTGDVSTLKQLLDKNPGLITARSMRAHNSTLLHYVGANGVENYRQQTPANAVEVANILLNAGADVNAISKSYGISTTLGLVASSIHPLTAGVQLALLDTLLDAGAAINGEPGECKPLIAALANGRGEAAKHLAQRSALLDIEGTAGAGALDTVKSFFNTDGSLTNNATKAQLESGFNWACEYGRNEVVTFLLNKGLSIHTGENTDMTGLHRAIVGAQLDTIRLLLDKGANTEALNVYGGNALGQAFWCIRNSDKPMQFVPVIETLLQAGALPQRGTAAWWAKQTISSAGVKEQVAELLKKY